MRKTHTKINLATITVENKIQKTLLETELLGQFSDGFWENSTNNSWKYFKNEIRISSDTGVVFDSFVPSGYKGYSVNNKKLLSYVGDRMLAYCKIVNALDIEIPDEVIYFIESIIDNDCNTSIENIEIVLSKWNKPDNKFYMERRSSAINFIEKVGIENFISAINSEYSMKDMRKELTVITKILKNVRS